MEALSPPAPTLEGHNHATPTKDLRVVELDAAERLMAEDRRTEDAHAVERLPAPKSRARELSAEVVREARGNRCAVSASRATGRWQDATESDRRAAAREREHESGARRTHSAEELAATEETPGPGHHHDKLPGAQ
jgi:hypothetical protein